MNMIKSMTGYGKAEAVLETGKLTIEIKTLNGKNSDANIKSSLLPKDKELLVRRKITDSLVRGTIDFTSHGSRRPVEWPSRSTRNFFGNITTS